MSLSGPSALPVDSVFLVPVGSQWLLHAPLTGVAAVVNTGAAKALREGSHARLAGDEKDLIDRALGSAAAPPWPPEGAPVPPMLGIIPTRGCNMACRYCNFEGPTSALRFMPPRVAVAAIDWAADRVQAAGRNDLNVQFFGGEPFVAFDVVELAVHRARQVSADRGLELRLDASSNGNYGERVCRFIGDHFDSLVLSLDGPADLQNRNRPLSGLRPSAGRVERTARTLSETPISLCLRMCVTSDSVRRMEEITKWMIDSFDPSMIDFETLTPGALADRAALRPPDPLEFARHFEGARRLAHDAGVAAVYAAAEAAPPRTSYCPVGNDSAIVDPDGRMAGCYLMPEEWLSRGLDLVYGRVGPDSRVEIDDGVLRVVREVPLSKPRCRRCFCRFGCAGGCHVNQTYPGSTIRYTDFCIQTRVLTACRLLRALEMPWLADSLLGDVDAMHRLTHHEDDAIGSDHPPRQHSAETSTRRGRNMGYRRVPGVAESPGRHERWTNEGVSGRRAERGVRESVRVDRRVRWAVENGGVAIVGADDEFHCLSYPEAALWEMLAHGRDRDALVRAMRCLADPDEAGIDDWIGRQTQAWLARGWIEVAPFE